MTAVASDPALVSEVRQYGAFDTNACYQCGTCTVTCKLSDDSQSFPRRPVRYALLGLREPLRGSLDPWLCYYCGDCSTSCPRQTEPAEAMMTLRRYLSAQYDWTGLASIIHRSAGAAVGAHLVVGAIVLLLVLAYHLYVVRLPASQFVSLPMGMEHMFGTITVFTIVVFLLAIALVCSNAARMVWFALHRPGAPRAPGRVYLTEAKTFLLHAIAQPRFRDCPDRVRWVKHLILVAGCVVMSVLVLFFLRWFQTDVLYPLSHPQRWMGYLAAGAMLYGATDILIGRLRKRHPAQTYSRATDWIFPVSLLLTALTGLAVHVLRYVGMPLTAHFAYAVHLAVAVPLLLIEIPFGKWSHMLYRPLAIYLQRVEDAVRARSTVVPEERRAA